MTQLTPSISIPLAATSVQINAIDFPLPNSFMDRSRWP